LESRTCQMIVCFLVFDTNQNRNCKGRHTSIKQ
jgi:hypothetical protein